MNGKVFRSSAKCARFTGTESRQEAFEIAKELFPEESVHGMKVGPLSGEETLSFTDRFNAECTMRKFMSEHRLKPSTTSVYLLLDEPTRKKTRDDRRNCPSNNDEADEVQDESDEDAEGDQPSKTQLDAVTKIPPEDLHQSEVELGTGSSATVYAGTWGTQDVALKVTSVPRNSDARYIHECICQEVAVHFKCRHPNIISLYGISLKDNIITLVTEKMDTSLGHVMDNKEVLSDDDKIFVCAQSAEGLAALHAMHVVHGDIKPCNILLDKSRKVVKLCDMGLARVKADIAATQTVRAKGTVPFMSPEILVHGNRASFTCDVWALGGTMAELFSEEDMWKFKAKRGYSFEDHLKGAMEKEKVPKALQVLKANERIYNVVAPCLAYKPSERPTARDLAQHLRQLLPSTPQE